MKKLKFREFFRSSQNATIWKGLINYGFMLLCGYLVSDLLQKVIEGTPKRLCAEIGITLVILVISAILLYALSVWCSRKQKEDAQNFREHLYRKVIDGTLIIENRGEMNVRFQEDVDTVANFFYDTYPKTITGILIMICSGSLLCFHNPLIGIIFLGLNFTQLIPVTVYEHWTKDVYDQTTEDEEAYQNWILEGYNGIKTLKSYHAENWFIEKYKQLNHNIIASGKRAELVGTIEDMIYTAIDALIQYGSFLVIGLLVLLGKANMVTAPLLLILAGYLYSSIRPVYDFHLDRYAYEEACKHLEGPKKAAIETSESAFVTADHISKSYEEKEVLRNVSCEIAPGDRIWMKGPNGSGKSTLLRIFTGTENVDSGIVTCGIARRQMAVLLQEEPDLTVTASELVQAMIEAGSIDKMQFDRHIQALGMSDVLKKSLSQMSPGERKKFYLSATFARNSDFMILDEPTNHVDQKSIRYLLAQMRTYPGTLLVSTHQDGLDWGSNRVFNMEEGVLHEG